MADTYGDFAVSESECGKVRKADCILFSFDYTLFRNEYDQQSAFHMCYNKLFIKRKTGVKENGKDNQEGFSIMGDRNEADNANLFVVLDGQRFLRCKDILRSKTAGQKYQYIGKIGGMRYSGSQDLAHKERRKIREI